MENPKPPKGLTKDSKKLWLEYFNNYESWNQADLRILNELCKINDLIKECEEKIKIEGLTQTDRFGQVIPHPLLRVLKENRTQLLRYTKALGLLDLKQEPQKIGRPGMY